MQWEQLISQRRLGYGDTGLADIESYQGSRKTGPLLGPFQNDVDRVLFSTAFRRLQGKAQVYMFPETDYVRTRLTHTIEVASIGRLLATTIFRKMMADRTNANCKKFNSLVAPRNNLSGLHQTDLVASITAACYAHDIGNAPFGHIGEYAIRSWFQEKQQAASGWNNLKSIDNSAEVRGLDFRAFDGNPQTFRLLARNMSWRDEGGLQLCLTTIASTLKYVDRSLDQKKKFGYFQSEQDIFFDIVEKLGMRNSKGEICRHPFSFIVEAADDIAYRVSDIEDAVKMGRVASGRAEEIFRIVLHDEGSPVWKRLDKIKNDMGRIRYLGSAVIERLVRACAETFVDNIDNILDGKIVNTDGEDVQSLLDGCLPTIIDFKNQVKTECIQHIYPEAGKLRNEQGAYTQIHSLLDLFGGMAEEYLDTPDGIEPKNHMNEKNCNVLAIITRNEGDNIGKDAYSVYQYIIDFVSGMTDRFASKLFQNLQGVSLSMR